METVADFIFLGSKITADGDCMMGPRNLGAGAGAGAGRLRIELEMGPGALARSSLLPRPSGGRMVKRHLGPSLQSGGPLSH